MIDMRDKRFFHLTEQNIRSPQHFCSNDACLDIHYVDDAMQNTIKPHASESQRLLFRLGLLFLCLLVGVAFFLSPEHTVVSLKESNLSDSKAAGSQNLDSQKMLVSMIPAFHVGASYQPLQNISLRIADLVASDVNVDEDMPNSTLVVMDKVIVIPKVILPTTTHSKEIV